MTIPPLLDAVLLPCTISFNTVDLLFARVLAGMQQRGVIRAGMISYRREGPGRRIPGTNLVVTHAPFTADVLDLLRTLTLDLIVLCFAALPAAAAFLVVVFAMEQFDVSGWWLLTVPTTAIAAGWLASRPKPADYMFDEVCRDNEGWQPLTEGN